MADISKDAASVQFYEKTSFLQGELKNYESQQFQLEEEFQRLWTQGMYQQHSSPNDHHDHLVSQHNRSIFTHAQDTGPHSSAPSQLLSSKPNPRNYHGRNEDVEGRHARNQAILDKLQELETNASIFAARSERLRLMRREFETLVKRYTLDRKLAGTSTPERSSLSTHFVSVQSCPNCQAVVEVIPKPERNLTSIAVNTDISGPIKPDTYTRMSSPTKQPIEPEQEDGHQSSHLQKKPYATANDRRILSTTLYNTASSLAKDNDECFDAKSSFGTGGRKTRENFPERRITFPDISSTSESEVKEFKAAALHQNVQTTNNEDSLDTSLSSLLPRFSKGLNHSNMLGNLSTDNSTSDLCSAKAAAASNPAAKLPGATLTKGRIFSSDLRSKPEKVSSPSNRISDKVKHSDNHEIKPDGQIELREQERAAEDDLLSDSTTAHSVDDSLMDSTATCNKTPESLPKDDSELVHISEEEEEEEEKADNNEIVEQQQVNQQDQQELLRRRKPPQLINERRNQIQGNWDNLSGSRVAEEEVGETVAAAACETSSVFVMKEIDKKDDKAVDVAAMEINSEELPERDPNKQLMGENGRAEKWQEALSKSPTRKNRVVGERPAEKKSSTQNGGERTLDATTAATMQPLAGAEGLLRAEVVKSADLHNGPPVLKGQSGKKIRIDYDDSDSDGSGNGLEVQTTATAQLKNAQQSLKEPTQKSFDDEFEDFFI